MTDDHGVGLIYGLEFQCRALTAVEADTDLVAFLVGTQSLKVTNQVHYLVLDEDTGSISKTVYSHDKGEIWDLVACPTDPNLCFSRHNTFHSNATNCSMSATLWSRAAETSDETDELAGGLKKLQALCKIEIAENGKIVDVNHVSFMPGQSSKVMALANNRLHLCDVSEATDGNAKLVSEGQLEGKGQNNLSIGAWNPHQNCQTFAAVNDHSVRTWDLRTMEQIWRIENPGNQVIRALDFNPNKQYYLATGGDDGCARFWDIRKPSSPVITRMDHSHWIWCLKYNQFHDQLVISSSSDSHVVLSCLASISSEPHGHIVDDEDLSGEEHPKPTALEDGILKIYEDHEESVYVAAWSSADPWIVASLSYDGRLVINQVPRDIKFKILNLL